MQAKLCLIILFDLHHDFQSQAEPDLLGLKNSGSQNTTSIISQYQNASSKSQ